MKKKIDGLLAEISALRVQEHEISAACEMEIEKIQVQYKDKLKLITDQIQAADRKLNSDMKKHKEDLFGDRDRVDLPHGAILYSVQEYVKKARGTLDALKQNGLSDGIKIIEKVRWETLDKWDAAKLALAGTSRVKKDCFSYEIK